VRKWGKKEDVRLNKKEKRGVGVIVRRGQCGKKGSYLFHCVAPEKKKPARKRTYVTTGIRRPNTLDPSKEGAGGAIACPHSVEHETVVGKGLRCLGEKQR